MKLLKIICLVCLLLCNSVFASENTVEVSSYGKYDKNNNLQVLLEFDIKDNWHVFAPYEQEVGAPLVIEWKNVDKKDILEQSYSKPERFTLDGFSFDGYEKKAFYKTTIKLMEFKPLTVKLKWLVCADECAPQSKTIVINDLDEKLFDKQIKLSEPYFLDKAYRPKLKFWFVLMMALAGGIILNLMPCVFPILGIKMLTLAKMTRNDRNTEALFYTLGVVFSMVVVAGILYILRKFDTSIGWGFQLQSSWFVGVMFVLFVILSLMMLDIINFDNGWIGKISLAKCSNPKVNAFMTGLLAVLIASPCTAPFMGAAIGYALMSPIHIYFPVFVFLGLGYSLPFVLIALSPFGSKKIMPKPGKWMIWLKRFFSIPLVLTCVWLGWLLLVQSGLVVSGQNLKWAEYSRHAVHQSIKKNKPVFIDFTASWCITCMVNKKAALQSDEFAELVNKKGISLFRADATILTPAVGWGLAFYGRASVPLYVYYDGKSDDYLILPQILTPNVLKEYLE